jgi:hypothetical protein
MHSPRYPVKAIAAGLLASQIIATLQVHLSNLDLADTLLRLGAHGYLLVPGRLIADHLGELKPAFIGGLFFTFSIGAGLTMATLGATWCWHQVFDRSRVFGVLAIGFWLLLIIAANGQGFSPVTSLYFLVVPPITFGAAMRWLVPANGPGSATTMRIHVLPVCILAVLWGAQWRSSMFLDIRDNLLLSNPVGTRIHDIYYEYTLYPALVFKTIDQKTLKTVRLEGFQHPTVQQSVERVLRHYDYLRTTDTDPVDVTIVQEGNGLAFYSGQTVLLVVTHEQFMASPHKALQAFSAKADGNVLFRNITIYGLVIGLPLVLYVMCHSMARFALAQFLSDQGAAKLATGMGFCIGLALLLVLYMGGSSTVVEDDIAANLDSERWQNQVAALRAMAGSGVDDSSLDTVARLTASSHVPVRYWLAVALAKSQRAETLRIIIELLDDPSANVVSKAYSALGERGNRTHIESIISAIENSDHWYVQLHAYEALRALGWQQERLD